MASPTRKPYPSDLTDAQWALLEPLVLAFENRPRPGPKTQVDLREVINTLLDLNRTGCRWAFVPHDLLPTRTVDDDFPQYRDHGVWHQMLDARRTQVRHSTPKAPGQEGMREPTPRGACVDRPTVKTTELGGAHSSDAAVAGTRSSMTGTGSPGRANSWRRISG